ncbi:hypothetical protein Ancab_026152, partial [Ancistrocladus abbreviatus]
QWGKLISLDGATSNRSRFDVARVLLSTSFVEPISTSILIKIKDSVFPIRVQEELEGASLFKHMVFYGKNLGDKATEPYSNVVSSSFDIEKEKVDEMPAKPLADDVEERASSQEISEKQYISRTIYEDARKSTPAIKNPPRATKNVEHKISRV